MASRFSSLRRPLAAAAVAATGGVVAYSAFNNNRGAHAFDKPLVELKRDNQGRIVPPSFPSIKDRASQLADLRAHSSDSEEYDLLIIGGGATGTGIALDAVTRGLKVALVERDDFSAGTSSKSTKLVHGGVRYLEKAVLGLDYSQLQLVMEALHERKTFLTVAPHLSSSLPILLPLKQWWYAPYAWAGTKMYDLLAGSQGLESSYYMSKSKAIETFPLLRRDNMIGALVYYDGQHNDSRMNVSLALTAAFYGATVLNHVEVTSLEKNSNGKICGAKVRDVMNPGSESFTVRAKGVVNATGPFTDAVERMDNPDRKAIVAPASGAHIMLPGNICPNGIGLLEASSDGRVIFVLPWQGHTLAGTTDTACAVEKEPLPRENDIDFILKEVNKLITPESTLSRSDVLAAWSGIRPLVKDPKAKNTESLVRSHLVTVSDSGLLTCAGGKWTTYRQMAEDAVDEAIKIFDLKPQQITLPDISGAGLPGLTTTGKCITTKVPLIGAHGFSTQLPGQLISHFSLDPDVAHHLATNYGDRAWSVAATSTARIIPEFPFVEGEIRHGVRAEMAQTATDLISRRTRLAFLNAESALYALPRVIDVMAEELGWSEARKAQEWTETVRFLQSMGLSQDKLGITRDEVLSSSGRTKATSAPKPQASVSSGGIKVGLGDIQAGGALARNATSQA
ncbi:Glycerol-3-phosphate dehydrogenase, mitochondrial 2 [Colletotrichum truncatum]|uniref:Glycerol-3-phosphate dehydrogenase, mitochondrial 2 n=1 Tax=Colletotrichum truncatum TaxID=5467 RepID=A0ACC3ZBR6_COLTU|nr:Glycerol-3-phosphate dehydrogenase, mitochondrial 2 [Colletotrichum truncatum]KAF6783828.1 Glycerol-3-phosphate dehydrogenase, mitochondrial 2 [Colletotrichum truncatum]